MAKMILSLIAGITLVVLAGHKIPTRPASSENGLLIPPKYIAYFTLGYDEVVADTFWIRVIQDFDTCGKNQLTNASPMMSSEAVVEGASTRRIGRCEMSWVYHMIDAITELAPKFRTVYSDGGVILSIAVDDVEGATKIYEKALKVFPNDFPIAYKAAYHYLYEAGDKARAAHLLTVAGANGGPKWLHILAARLYSKAGKAELGLRVMRDFLEANPDKADDPHVKKRMAEIERDLAAGDGPEATPAPELLRAH
ncbi:MAG: hypothetical protein EOP06_20340, partial [Proteobacteria bacterium]